MRKLNTNVKASIIIPTKNAGSKFVDLLEALACQETDWLFDVLIIDSGSKDGTVEIVRQQDSITLIEIKPEDFGHGKTRNYAISQTTGEFIVMITQDAIPVNSKWLAELVRIVEQDSKIAGAFGRHIAYPDASPFIHNEMENHFRGFKNEPIVEIDDVVRYDESEEYRQYLYFFSDNNAILRRTVWERIPYPEVDFAEDQAWARLIVESGYKKAYAHDAIVWHSHNYSFTERFKRSYTESYALYNLFNYKNNRSLSNALYGFIGLTIRDIKLVLRKEIFFSNFADVIVMPLNNLLRVTGHYYGSNRDVIPNFIQKFLF